MATQKSGRRLLLYVPRRRGADMEQAQVRRSALVWSAALAAGAAGVAASFLVIPVITEAFRSGFLYVPEASVNGWIGLILNRVTYFVLFVVIPAINTVQLVAGAVGTARGSARAAGVAAAGAGALLLMAGLVTAATVLGALPPWNSAFGIWTLIHGAVALVVCFCVLTLATRAAEALRRPI
jgi:uncharacterized protein YybS (DUF2232 family)